MRKSLKKLFTRGEAVEEEERRHGPMSLSTMDGGSCSSDSMISAESALERPQITYGLVTRSRSVVLAEHLNMPGNFQEATLHILQNTAQIEEWSSILYGDHCFHILVDDAAELEFVCMADPRMMRRVPFGFLSSLQESFVKEFPKDATDAATEYQMQTAFRPDLQALMEKWNSPSADRLSAMMEKVKDINDGLVESMESILIRQERIQHLAKSSELLSQSSMAVRQQARTLHRRMWWKNLKTMAIIAATVIIVLLVLLLSVCGVTFKSC